MRRRILIAVLAVGAIGGYAHGFASLHAHHHAACCLSHHGATATRGTRRCRKACGVPCGGVSSPPGAVTTP